MVEFVPVPSAHSFIYNLYFLYYKFISVVLTGYVF